MTPPRRSSQVRVSNIPIVRRRLCSRSQILPHRHIYKLTVPPTHPAYITVRPALLERDQ